MTSDSLTTNSPDTPDGKPVIEIFQADPNVLIKTTQTAAEGNLDVDTATGLGTLDIKMTPTQTINCFIQSPSMTLWLSILMGIK